MTPAALSTGSGQAYAVVDARALRHNLAVVRNLAPDAKVMAVIKANGYGHGLLCAASALHEVEAFAVAQVQEGIALREAGFSQRIVVLQGFIDQEELLAHVIHHLEPVIHALAQVYLLEREPLPEPLSLWLKLDSGMNRLGVSLQEFPICLRHLRRCLMVKQPVGLMTHLCNADLTEDDATLRQISLFRHAMAYATGETSIANSAGILAWPDSHADWVRPGIMLYGVSPFAGRCGVQEGLKPVMTLHSRLIAVKWLRKGDKVGYGGDWTSPRDTRLGIAAIGYGDGYPRHAPSGTPVLLRDRRVALAGRASMDMISLDLFDCPDAQVGDTVTLWGEGLPVEEIARHADTIPYTLLCNVTQRVRLMEPTDRLASGDA